MRVLLIDNYDSFTYNLAQLLAQTGLCEYEIRLNDQVTLESISAYDRILISPGPGLPQESGMILEAIRRYAPEKPILGICLGLQAVAQVFGGKLVRLQRARHGQVVETHVECADPLFRGLPAHFPVALYHSWAVDPVTVPPQLRIIATGENNAVMGLRHALYNVAGLQFHPESVATRFGLQMIRNWLTQ